MALPPISSLPILNKIFRADQTAKTSVEQKAESSVAATDVVDISAAAQEDIPGVKDLSSADLAEVESAASNARELIAANEEFALGLDAGFDEAVS